MVKERVLESIYFVVTWLCHRTCRHCYDDRFRPYYGQERQDVVSQSVSNLPRIVENLPEHMRFVDRRDGITKRGRIILAGGEVLLDPVREAVLYPALAQLHDKYDSAGGVDVIVQTTGDLVSERIVDELLRRRVGVISVSGLDEFHDGFEPQSARERLQAKLTGLFVKAGMSEWTPGEPADSRGSYHFFGATPDSWIGRLWPRGRAFTNELSTATVEDNFCNAWSGGLKFLDFEQEGSEVSIDPEGNVYPCCIKTRKALGNLLEEPLIQILRRLRGNPVYEAISAGEPQRMGLAYGWSEEKFREKSRIQLASGRMYQNLCIGCDAFHEKVLMRTPLVQITSSP